MAKKVCGHPFRYTQRLTLLDSIQPKPAVPASNDQYETDLAWYKQLLAAGETPVGLGEWWTTLDGKLRINNIELVCRFPKTYFDGICGYVPSDQRNATLIQHVTGVHKVDRHTGIFGREGRGSGAPTKKEKDFRAEWLRRVRAQHEAILRAEDVTEHPDDLSIDEPRAVNMNGLNSISKQVNLPDKPSEGSEEDSFGFS